MRKPPQRMYHCVNGPLHRTKLSLATPVTMPFTINSESGRYRPALFVIKCEGLGGHTYTKTVTEAGMYDHHVLSLEIKYQNQPAGKNIYWEPL